MPPGGPAEHVKAGVAGEEVALAVVEHFDGVVVVELADAGVAPLRCERTADEEGGPRLARPRGVVECNTRHVSGAGVGVDGQVEPGDAADGRLEGGLDERRRPVVRLLASLEADHGGVVGGGSNPLGVPVKFRRRVVEAQRDPRVSDAGEARERVAVVSHRPVRSDVDESPRGPGEESGGRPSLAGEPGGVVPVALVVVECVTQSHVR